MEIALPAVPERLLLTMDLARQLVLPSGRGAGAWHFSNSRDGQRLRWPTVPDPDGRLTTAERTNYDPGPCPYCGQRTVNQQWVNTRSMADTQDWWMPGRKSCRNRECPATTGTGPGG